MASNPIFILQATPHGRLAKRVVITTETAAYAQLRRALASKEFERVVLFWEKPGGTETLFNSSRQQDFPAIAAHVTSPAARRQGARGSWAIVTGLIIVILFFALKWALKG